MRLGHARRGRLPAQLLSSNKAPDLLALAWQPGEDGTGQLALEFAGDGTIVADVECISVDLRDVTRPYAANSGHMPRHDDA